MASARYFVPVRVKYIVYWCIRMIASTWRRLTKCRQPSERLSASTHAVIFVPRLLCDFCVFFNFSSFHLDSAACIRLDIVFTYRWRERLRIFPRVEFDSRRMLWHTNGMVYNTIQSPPRRAILAKDSFWFRFWWWADGVQRTSAIVPSLADVETETI